MLLVPPRLPQGFAVAESVPYFLLTVFALSYGGKTLGLDKTLLNDAILIVSVLAFAARGLFAALSDTAATPAPPPDGRSRRSWPAGSPRSSPPRWPGRMAPGGRWWPAM